MIKLQSKEFSNRLSEFGIGKDFSATKINGKIFKK